MGCRKRNEKGGNRIRTRGIDLNKLRNWSINTKNHHTKRGIWINAKPREIYQTAFQTIQEHNGCCPECGEHFTQITHDPHELTLENLGNGEYEVICATCNQNRAISQQQKGFTTVNGEKWIKMEGK